MSSSSRRRARASPSSAANHFDPAIHGTGVAVGVRKDDTELRDRFSAAIAAIREDGTYETIAGKYFDFDVYGG